MIQTDDLSDFLHLCLPPSPIKEYSIEEIEDYKWEIIRRLRKYDEMTTSLGKLKGIGCIPPKTELS